MPTEEAVLAANEAFYRAFDSGDLDAMESLWARHMPVACIHPGSAVLTDRRTVMESWRTILDSGARPSISCCEATAHLCGDAAFVTCYEDLRQGFLVATNIFVWEDDRWKMVHHQAGPTNAEPGDAMMSPSDSLH